MLVGASWGGVQALRAVLGGLPSVFLAPVVVVLHRSPEGSDELCFVLQAASLLTVVEAKDKMQLLPGYVYIAPAGYHLLVEPGELALNVDEPVQYARPSIDVMFVSTADVYGNATVGVILTGSGSDGARGLGRLKAMGATTIVQDPVTAENRGMPDAAILSVRVDHVVPLPAIEPLLSRLATPLEVVGLKNNGAPALNGAPIGAPSNNCATWFAWQQMAPRAGLEPATW